MEKSSRSQGSASSIEADLQDQHLQSKLRTIRMTDAARAGTTLLALLTGLTILGVSANTLRVYQGTHVSRDFMLPLWPDEFDLRPTLSLVAGSAVVVLANLVALGFGQVGALRAPRAAAAAVATRTATAFLAPLAGLAGTLVAVAFFYAVNASDAADTFLSWTCRWEAVPMWRAPRWAPLCRQARAALYLAVLLIPVELAALALAAFQLKVERYTERYLGARKTPVLS
ncbi:hypothetical protein MYCTH_2143764 [Thermothelomyces thermophilus ATCC 42464]|uniref:Uncharacterized protein n=1 Tax=Thermothelomyces thermophilus (strain ATCC 42464 / BCRC 31852 / DSM 1799) TaxID=573729 RepID=G2QEI0_THET4|nr:uncharacterized protein MYCTH_2143764 [Thermothelomyces thermophilus ATCC 42464]AEO57763.1 hypothetical protein MYCTH_2143764 [Thermothelomyces thermophilus ATCC 42464]